MWYAHQRSLRTGAADASAYYYGESLYEKAVIYVVLVNVERRITELASIWMEPSVGR